MISKHDELDRHLPLNPRTYAILLVLSDEPTHGYRIKREVEERSRGAIELDPGSLYRAIAKLVRDELVEECFAKAGADATDHRRRYYALTLLGRRVAQAETRRLNALIQTGSAQALLERGEES